MQHSGRHGRIAGCIREENRGFHIIGEGVQGSGIHLGKDRCLGSAPADKEKHKIMQGGEKKTGITVTTSDAGRH